MLFLCGFKYSELYHHSHFVIASIEIVHRNSSTDEKEKEEENASRRTSEPPEEINTVSLLQCDVGKDIIYKYCRVDTLSNCFCFGELRMDFQEFSYNFCYNQRVSKEPFWVFYN